jgi:molybdopterin-containing oxidoreductase family iron-sulfur binding subunit
VNASKAPSRAVDAARRRLLAGVGAAAVLALAPGVVLIAGRSEARPPGTPASTKTRWGLLIDVNKCAEGCDACVAACRRENGWEGYGRPATDAQWIRKVSVRDPRTGVRQSLPVLCQHCAQAPCVYVCPTGASFRRDDGIVLVDKHVCIGCRYCMMACPFAARSFVHEDVTDPRPHAPRGKGTVESCTLCVHRVDEGRAPACVEACAAIDRGALTFGDLNDPASAIAREVGRHAVTRLRADLGLDPSVVYRGL